MWGMHKVRGETENKRKLPFLRVISKVLVLGHIVNQRTIMYSYQSLVHTLYTTLRLSLHYRMLNSGIIPYMKHRTGVSLSDDGAEVLEMLAASMGIARTAVIEIALRDMAKARGIAMPEPKPARKFVASKRVKAVTTVE